MVLNKLHLSSTQKQVQTLTKFARISEKVQEGSFLVGELVAQKKNIVYY